MLCASDAGWCYWERGHKFRALTSHTRNRVEGRLNRTHAFLCYGSFRMVEAGPSPGTWHAVLDDGTVGLAVDVLPGVASDADALLSCALLGSVRVAASRRVGSRAPPLLSLPPRLAARRRFEGLLRLLVTPPSSPNSPRTYGVSRLLGAPSPRLLRAVLARVG